MSSAWDGELSGDGSPEHLMGGDLNEVKPIVGQYNASNGVAISINSRSPLTTHRSADSGWFVQGGQHVELPALQWMMAEPCWW